MKRHVVHTFRSITGQFDSEVSLNVVWIPNFVFCLFSLIFLLQYFVSSSSVSPRFCSNPHPISLLLSVTKKCLLYPVLISGFQENTQCLQLHLIMNSNISILSTLSIGKFPFVNGISNTVVRKRNIYLGDQ